ncbi:type VI secretion system baseplate subunit TssK [Psychrosphaera algicola]|uniref:Type VI secretion system baseplate subunit TssK n=1 Tax=Psychrosphaera algicola TaxID=3023714 RepID=A0ABT5FF72_9GAMM|nr:type VI secretion system baseplate subunit TssK [Psychrosphaera sp. G1-22]MDC2890168.1 type VI secretion system baseplate subunit TssK [Psychrosphaera sp. G1-22]
MNFNKPLFWHQGLFLQPQHFQYQSLHSQQAVYQLYGINNPFPWGVSNMHLDSQALNRGFVELNTLDVLYEDGSLVSFPENALIAPRSFESHWQDRTKGIIVLAVISKLSDSRSNVTQVPSYDNSQIISTRYVSSIEGESIKDVHQGDQSVTVKTMKYVVRLIFEDEIEQFSDCLIMPITKLEEIEDVVMFSKEFIPASVCINASSIMMDQLKEIRDELLGRSKQLENYKNTSTSRSAEFNPVSERYRSALRVIARYAPMLNHYLEHPSITPFEMFGHIRALIGELSTFSARYSILGESLDGTVSTIKYNHRELFQSFEKTKALLVSLLDELTVSPELLVRLEKQDDGSYNCKLPSEFFVRQHSMYLLLESNLAANDYISSFKNYAKLGAKSHVERYVQSAILGVEFTHLDEQPTGLEQRPKVTYFTIDRTSSKWKAIEEEGMFAVHWDDAPDDLIIEMVLVRG